MVRKPPIRCQAMADSFLASSSRGLVATADRDLRAALGCADIPMDCLSLDQDFVVVNKVGHYNSSSSSSAFVVLPRQRVLMYSAQW